VAQDVEKVLPEVVTTDKQGYKSIDYSKISAVLAEAVKEQQKEIDKQQKENEDLRKLIEQLAAEVDELKATAKQ
jgi:malate/lactate dehydrogenase